MTVRVVIDIVWATRIMSLLLHRQYLTNKEALTLLCSVAKLSTQEAVEYKRSASVGENTRRSRVFSLLLATLTGTIFSKLGIFYRSCKIY